MSAGTIIVAGRRAAEALMASTCRITRFTPVTLDTVTLRFDDPDPSDDLIYTGPCRLKADSSRVFTQDAEGQLLTEEQLTLYLPLDGTETVQTDDRVTITDGGPDPALTGRVFRIRGIVSQTYATARRLPIENWT